MTKISEQAGPASPYLVKANEALLQSDVLRAVEYFNYALSSGASLPDTVRILGVSSHKLYVDALAAFTEGRLELAKKMMRNLVVLDGVKDDTITEFKHRAQGFLDAVERATGNSLLTQRGTLATNSTEMVRAEVSESSPPHVPEGIDPGSFSPLLPE